MKKLTDKKIADILKIYTEFKSVYGPYRRKDGRDIVILYDGKKRSARQLARVLLEVHLGRRLENNETVDHINEDFSDHRISNLRVLSREENAGRSAVTIIKKTARCVLCGKVFEMSRNQISNRSAEKVGPFCGKSCATKSRHQRVFIVEKRKVIYNK